MSQIRYMATFADHSLSVKYRDYYRSRNIFEHCKLHLLHAVLHIYHPQKYHHTAHSPKPLGGEFHVILHLTACTRLLQPVLSQERRMDRTLNMHEKGVNPRESVRSIMSRCMKEIEDEEHDKKWKESTSGEAAYFAPSTKFVPLESGEQMESLKLCCHESVTR